MVKEQLTGYNYSLVQWKHNCFMVVYDGSISSPIKPNQPGYVSLLNGRTNQLPSWDISFWYLPGNLPVLLWHVINLQESAGATNCRLVDLDSFAAYTIHIYIYIHTLSHFSKIDFVKYWSLCKYIRLKVDGGPFGYSIILSHHGPLLSQKSWGWAQFFRWQIAMFLLGNNHGDVCTPRNVHR